MPHRHWCNIDNRQIVIAQEIFTHMDVLPIITIEKLAGPKPVRPLSPGFL